MKTHIPFGPHDQPPKFFCGHVEQSVSLLHAAGHPPSPASVELPASPESPESCTGASTPMPASAPSHGSSAISHVPLEQIADIPQ
jgi:hypothetical protein